LLLAATGYWLIRRMLVPLRRLSAHLDRGVSGPIEPIPLSDGGPEGGEFRRLYDRFNAMAEAVNEREALAKRLAQEERLGSLGRLASGMAHEINNPLGGLFNAIDTLKVHGDKLSVRAASLDLIERGLRGIRDVVRSVLATYRDDERNPRELMREDLEDVRLLARPEAERRGINLLWSLKVADNLPLAASKVRQIVLNLVLNAVHATPSGATVSVAIASMHGELAIDVEDQGPGMPRDAADVLQGRTTHPIGFGEGTGLGLWMTRRLVLELGGKIENDSTHSGTAMRVRLPLSHARELRDVA
jgi:signal transduction histidine kinase